MNETLPTDEMFLILYTVIDDLYQLLVPSAVRERPSSEQITFSDSEVLTLSIMQEACSNDSETSFHRIVAKNHLDLFPTLPSRSRYHRRRKALLQVQLHLLRYLMHHLRRAAAYVITDSAPIETAHFVRSQSAKRSIPEAAYGYAPTKKRTFFGFRLHALLTNEGALVDFVLSPADVGEREVGEHLLTQSVDVPSLADNGYSGYWLAHLVGRHGGRLWVSERPTAPTKTKEQGRLRRFLRGKRALIETVFSMLADQFTLETTRARSLLGLKTRVAAKLLAFDVSIVINHLLARPALAMKSLYM